MVDQEVWKVLSAIRDARNLIINNQKLIDKGYIEVLKNLNYASDKVIEIERNEQKYGVFG